MHPILNYMEFRTNPEPYMVQGVWCMINGALNHVGFRASHAPYVVHGGERGIRTLDPVVSGIHDFQSCPFGLSGISPFQTLVFSSKFGVRSGLLAALKSPNSEFLPY